MISEMSQVGTEKRKPEEPPLELEAVTHCLVLIGLRIYCSCINLLLLSFDQFCLEADFIEVKVFDD